MATQRALFEDTPPQIEAILLAAFRDMDPFQKLERVFDLSGAVKLLAEARIREQHPGITAREVRLRLASLWLDRETMRRVFDWDPAEQGVLSNPALSEAIEVTFLVVAALERIGVRYLVGGSLASSLHGVPRSTLDVDLVAMLAQPHVARFVASLEGGFYVDAEMIRDAIRRRSCFHVIHLQTVFKVDVFVMPDTEESLIEMERGRTVTIPGDPPRTLVVASAEAGLSDQ